MGESGDKQNSAVAIADARDGQAYFGNFRHAIDDKHRVTIPARWRQSEAEPFYLLPSPDDEHLSVLPPLEFRKVSETVNGHPGISPADRRWFTRFYFSQAQLCTLDRQGRLLIPDDFCQLADLTAEAVLAGTFDRFEIWNPARWEAAKLGRAATYQQVADLIGI